MRDSMVFYRSFSEALDHLPSEQYKEAMHAILHYAFDGTIPDCEGIAYAIYIMAKPQIDANNRKYENGKKGGRPSKQTETKEKPNNNQSKTKENPTETKPKPQKENAKPNVYVNVNDNVNVDSKESNIRGYSDDFEKVWKAYPRKKEKASAYKSYKARLKDYTPDQLLLATQRYAEECKILDTEDRYIKHGSTFFGSSLPFTDYLAEDYIKPVARSGTKTENSFNQFSQRTYDFAKLERKLSRIGRTS